MYINAKIASKRNVLGKVKVYLNGKIIPCVLAAKCGKNGFVEYFDKNPKFNKRRGDIIRYKKRGLVKLSFNL